jgi:uncharacterized protein YndB with AHSA1/START domain
MPIKHDGTGKRWVEMEILLPGTPEQVWEAMATGPGNGAWFVPGEIEPRVGGKFGLDFGGGVVTTGEVTAWDPPRNISYLERDWAPGAPPVATEITIIGRSGGHCLMRMVHSLFTTSDDWDDQVEGFEKGWPSFFEVLRIYLKHFAGLKAASFMHITATSVDPLAAWQRLGEALGIAGANVGERRTVSSGPERLTCIVEGVHQDGRLRWVSLRTEAPGPGVVLVGTLGAPVEPGDIQVKLGEEDSTKVSVNRYFYGDSAEQLKAERVAGWQEWMGRTFEAQGAAK